MARSSSLMSIVIALAFLGLSSFNVVDARSVETVERQQPLDEDWICTVCNHVYNAAKDGNGQPFASLPSSWVCPVCGAPKSAYKQKTTSDGSVQWVHDEPAVETETELTTADGVWKCTVCNHIYDATKDGNGQPFASLPSSWVCPVCGAPKSAYKQTTSDGSVQWVHDEAVETKVVEDVIGDVDIAVEVTTADGVWTCSVCNHIYDATKDGNGQPFESLPSSWVCPVCGAPKSAYKQKAGSNEWVH